MSRFSMLMRGLDPAMKGLEIGPWFAPLAPKRAGWNVRILDVFDTATLRDRGRAEYPTTGRDPALI